MKQHKHYYTPIIITIFLLLSGHGVWGQGTIISWNFTSGNTPNINLPSGTTSISFSTGGTVGTSGCTSNGYSSNGWNVNEYLEIVAPTNGYIITSLSFDAKSSNTGPGNFKFQYSSTGTSGTFIDLGTSFQSTNSSSCGTYNANFSGINTLNNNSNTVIRIVFTGGEADGVPATGDASGTGTFRIDDIVITGSAISTTYTTFWSNNSPTSSIDAIIDGDLIASTDLTCKNLTVNTGKTLTITSGTRLTVNGNIVNDGTLTLESGATLVQDGSGTVAGSGTFNVKQALTGAGGATPSGRFWYLGSPVSTANSGVFNAAGNNRLWTYSETALAYNTEINDNTTALSPMQGAVVRLGADETSIFTGGLLNTGDYTSSLTRTGTTDSKRGYTLLSNPYPSYLDWTAAFTAAAATNANISSSIWYRSHNSTSNTMVFDIFNASSSVATTNSSGTTTQYIPPMQAFWVYNPTDGATGSLTFSNSMRSHQSNGGLKSSTDFPAFVRLNLENDGAIDQTVLYFDNNAAAGYDNFDSDKMMLANAAQVYSFVDNKKLAINGMKSIKANKQVPLTVEFPTAKSYSFNATEVAMTDGIVILEDRLIKVFQDLTMNPVYNFDAAAGTDANRFVVHFQANGGVAGIETAEDNGIAIVSNASGLVTITLSEELPAMGTIQIIDINGKVIATQAINEQTTTMNINAATGVYHVLVDSAAKVARKKIVITK
jgi:hypothetical protein